MTMTKLPRPLQPSQCCSIWTIEASQSAYLGPAVARRRTLRGRDSALMLSWDAESELAYDMVESFASQGRGSCEDEDEVIMCFADLHASEC